MITKFDIGETVYIPVKITAFRKNGENQFMQYHGYFMDCDGDKKMWFNEKQFIKADQIDIPQE